ncbi:MAG TPA: glycosyltransferase [Hyphomicrobiaceae bacterium]|nr:glycosyltransferase [Hyphomicrobiaceae bacterium]
MWPRKGQGPGSSFKQVEQEYGFLLGRLIDRETLARSDREARSLGLAPHQVLLARGWVRADQYVEALSGELWPALRSTARVPTSTVLIDATSDRPYEIGRRIAAEAAAGRAAMLVSPSALTWGDVPISRAERVEEAAAGFRRRYPEHSAAAPARRWQVWAAVIAASAGAGMFALAPGAAWLALCALIAIPFLCVAVVRVLALVLLAGSSPGQVRRVRRRPDAELPVYTILVPMLREAEVLADFIAALRALDYPPAKLDVILILEGSDLETQLAAAEVDLPGFVRVVVVPDAPPRTKPKALNYGLQFARGDYVTVYDAEDVADRGQLREALALFQEPGTRLACVQAQLSTYNPCASWLTRQFTLEYSALFDGILPALSRLGLPLPLGGTSNHFPRAVLDAVGGWDPHNVTEDADLGIRIARRGGRIAVLASTTWEEAPETFVVWMRQRTRWLKGWMLTYLVHMRRPARLFHELGLWRFLGFQMLMGGLILSALVHPLFYLMLAHAWAGGPFMQQPASAPEFVLLALAVFNLAAGYLTAMVLAAATVCRRRRLLLAFDVVLMPLYWLLISLAAYRALVQVLRAPHLWEKTPHACRSRRAK